MVGLRVGKLVALATLTALLFWFFPAFEAPAGAQAQVAQVATWDR